MSINELSRVSDLLNPCRFSDTVRQQAYTQAQLSDVGPPGGQLRFSIPNNTTVDLSNAYIVYDLVSVNQIAETSLSFNIVRPAVAAASGTWQLLYSGQSIGGVDNAQLSFNHNTPVSTILSTLNNFYIFKGSGLLATSTNGAGDSFATTQSINITVSSFDSFDFVPTGFLVTSALFSAVPAFLPLSINGLLPDTSVQGVLQTPRIEKTSPIFNRVYIQVNGTTVFDVQGANRLYSALNFIDTEFDSVGKANEDAYLENGTIINGRRKCRFFLNWIDLFQSIFPLDIIPNAQIILYMDLEQPNLALICSNSANNANQSYRIQNAKIKYHTLQLPESDKRMLRNELKNGITIPFLNWVYFADVLNAGTVNKQSIFNPSVSNLLGVLFVMVDQSYYQNATHKRKLSTFLRNNMNTYRLKVGNLYFPLDKVESSNTYYSITEQARELILLAQIINRKPIVDDMEAFSNYSGTITGAGGNPEGNDPTNELFNPWFQNTQNMMSVFGISTADIGFADKTHLCSRIALHGVDTSVLPNVVLELEGMSVLNNDDLNIFSLSQDYVTFFENKFEWKH